LLLYRFRNNCRGAARVEIAQVGAAMPGFVRQTKSAQEMRPFAAASGDEAGGEVAPWATVTVWTEVASRYAPRAMSEPDMAAAARELYDGGAITFRDYTFMAAPASFITKPDEGGRRDMIREMEFRDFLRGEAPDQAGARNILEILKRLEAAAAWGRVDLVA
jgi:hypothetical protein